MQSSELDSVLRKEFKTLIKNEIMSHGSATEEEKASWKEGGAKHRKMWEEEKEKTRGEISACWDECSTDGICNEAQWITVNKKIRG